MSDESFRDLGWVDGIEAWTVAVVRGRAADEVVRIYGGDPARPAGEATFAEVDAWRAEDADDVAFYLGILVLDDVVVAIENDGYGGAFPEIARRCSAGGGAFFSVYWNIHAAGMVTQVIDGVVTARFESLYPLAPEVGPWELRPQWAIGAEVAAGQARRVCLSQLERQTGVPVEPGWVTEPLRTFRVPEPYGLYRDVAGADRV